MFMRVTCLLNRIKHNRVRLELIKIANAAQQSNETLHECCDSEFRFGSQAKKQVRGCAW